MNMNITIIKSEEDIISIYGRSKIILNLTIMEKYNYHHIYITAMIVIIKNLQTERGRRYFFIPPKGVFQYREKLQNWGKCTSLILLFQFREIF